MTDTAAPRVRFAPSPTGYLHIGGARTALMNYLYAKHHGGKFLLRIEDTDLERSSEAMIQYIIDGLDWLGIHPDEPYVLQSNNRSKHIAAAEKLLSSGKAYRCFCSKETLDAERDKVQSEGKIYRYSGMCRHLSAEEIDKNINTGIPYTVRLKVPEGVTQFKDMVFGKNRVNNAELDDFIILRGDGTPIYQLAVVIDDADMQITHVIRGEDHLSNTPKQILLYQALNLPVPEFAHVPLILGPDGKRLSKRFGATSVGEFQELGFIADGVINSLALLGWSPKNNTTIFSMNELMNQFDMSGVGKKGAIFDFDKMKWINGQHITRTGSEQLYKAVTTLWVDRRFILKKDVTENKTGLLAIIELMKERIRLIGEFAEFGAYFFKDPESYDEEAVLARWSDPVIPELLTEVQRGLAALNPFNAESSERVVRNVAEAHEQKAALIIHALRLAITGFSVSPGIFQVLELLGREVVLRRIVTAVERMKK